MDRAALLPIALALAGCADAPGAGAERALSLGRWEEAAAHLERGIAEAPAARAARLDLYNLACARALAGRTEAALDALEASLADGPGDVGFDHLAEDPDLLPLHGEPRWEALLRRLSWSGETAVLDGAAAGRPPAVVVLVGREESPAPIPGARLAVPVPPYRTGPAERAWRTRLDPGARAGETAVHALRAAEEGGGTDPARRILRASGAEGVRLAWEILLRHPGVFTRAVLDGPAPPRRALLDRGADRMGTEILVAGIEGVPDPVVGARVRSCGSADAALREALR